MGIPRPADERRHEALFLERYDLLVGWATKLVERDRASAHDLVQEAFVQFVLARPELDVIENLDGYLFRMLRNLHVSDLRRAARSPAGPASLIEYETAELGLAAGDLRRQVEIQDDLRRLCRFLSARTLSSKAASVLIFRFFLGYYPAEIARIAGCSRQEIAVLLHTARAEARVVLTRPRRLRLLSLKAAAVPAIKFSRTDADFIAGLRLAILCLRHGGSCASRDELQLQYAADAPASIDAERLAHLATCDACLDRTNRVLGLPPLSERHPTDMLGRDRGGDGSSGTGGASGSSGADIKGSAANGASAGRRKTGAGHSRRSFGGAAPGGPDDPRWRQVLARLRAIHDHVPNELRVVVDGAVRGTQRIVSAYTELTLGLHEGVEFVEILSEQGVRLLFVTIDQPPSGPFEYHAQLALSDDRRLDLRIDLGGVWPHVLVEYRSPLWLTTAAIVPSAEAATQSISSHDLSLVVRPPAPVVSAAPAPVNSAAGWWPLCMRWLQPWLRPVLVGVRVTLIAVLVMSLLSWPGRHVSASALLQDAAVAATRAAAARAPVTYRGLSLQERVLSPSRIVARRRLEVWTHAARGVAATRVYDEQSGLIAGEWRHSDGQRTLYRPHAAPTPLPELSWSPGTSSSALDIEALGRREPSVDLFTSLIGAPEAASVREQDGEYIIEYHAAPTVSPSTGTPVTPTIGYALRSATLTLRRSDLHPIAQTFVVDVAGETREITVTETSFEAPAPTTIHELVFEPDPELLAPAATPIATRLPPTPTAGPIARPEPMRAPALPPLERDNLELRLWYGLQRSGVWLGEHAHVDYAANGNLVVQVPSHGQAWIESARRTLGALVESPHVLLTFAPETATPNRDAAAYQGTPMHQMLQTHFIRVLSERPLAPGRDASVDPMTARLEAVDQAVTQLIDAMIERSRQRSARARAMEALVTRWAPDTLRTLPLDTRALWLAMLRTHARALAQDTEALQSWLQPVTMSASDLPTPSEPDPLASAGVVDLAALTRRVAALVKVQDSQLEAACSTPVSALDVTSIEPGLLEVEQLLAQFNLPQSLDP